MRAAWIITVLLCTPALSIPAGKRLPPNRRQGQSGNKPRATSRREDSSPEVVGTVTYVDLAQDTSADSDVVQVPIEPGTRARERSSSSSGSSVRPGDLTPECCDPCERTPGGSMNCDCDPEVAPCREVDIEDPSEYLPSTYAAQKRQSRYNKKRKEEKRRKEKERGDAYRKSQSRNNNRRGGGSGGVSVSGSSKRNRTRADRRN